MKIAVCIILLMLCAFARASIIYDVSIPTASLPPGQYQAAFFLTDPAAPENFSRAELADSFSIDGLISDSTHYYASQPVIPFTVGEPGSWPLTFDLILTGAEGSPDYFFLAIRTPDGGMLEGPDGSQWLLWAAMGTDPPRLNYDLPGGMNASVAQVPEPLSSALMLAGMGMLLMRRRAA